MKKVTELIVNAFGGASKKPEPTKAIADFLGKLAEDAKKKETPSIEGLLRSLSKYASMSTTKPKPEEEFIRLLGKALAKESAKPENPLATVLAEALKKSEPILKSILKNKG